MNRRIRRASLPTWVLSVWFFSAVAFVAGLVAAASEGESRQFALLALLVSALSIGFVVSGRKEVPTEHVELEFMGQHPIRRRLVRSLQLVIAILYNLGFVVVILAAFARFDITTAEYSQTTIAIFPALIGTFVALLGVGAQWRIAERGGVGRTWYTKAHGSLLTILGAVVTIAGIILVTHGRLIWRNRIWLDDADLVVMVLLVVVFVGTQTFLAAGLPSILKSVTHLMRRRRMDEDEGTPPILYAAMVAIVAVAALAYLFSRFDFMQSVRGFRDERIGLAVLLFPVGLALFFLASGMQVWRQSKRAPFTKRLENTVRLDVVVYTLSGLVGLLGAVLLALTLTQKISSFGPFEANLNFAKDLTAFTIIASMGPVGFYLHQKHKRIDHIESRLPDFLNDLAETRHAGLTLTAALQATSLADYGALSPDVQKMSNQVSWGVAFTDALQQFAERVPTMLVRRSTSLIIQASRTGGAVTEILRAAAKDAFELKALAHERRVTMLTYLVVIYVVFFVFLGVVFIMDAQFIPQVLAATKAVEGSNSPFGGGGSSISQDTLRYIYFNAAMVQAVGNGLVGGVLAENRVTAGFRHAMYMTATSWILFRIVFSI